jgi:protein TonB
MKKYFFIYLLSLLSVGLAKAQTEDTTAKKGEVFTAVEKSASYPGGMEKLYNYLQSHIKYPDAAKKAELQGIVFLTFVIEKDGSLTDMKVVRGRSPELDAEAMRVMQLTAKWTPGTQGGVPVRQRYTVPISFKLPN